MHLQTCKYMPNKVNCDTFENIVYGQKKFSLSDDLPGQSSSSPLSSMLEDQEIRQHQTRGVMNTKTFRADPRPKINSISVKKKKKK